MKLVKTLPPVISASLVTAAKSGFLPVSVLLVSSLILVVGLGCGSSESQSGNSQGFVSLFDGKTLSGWQGSPDHWIPGDGRLIYKPPREGEKKSRLELQLMSDREYSDFILRFEFKLDPSSNNGVAIRSPMEGDPAFMGMEIQVIDTTGWTRGQLKPFQVHGSIYGVVPAKTGHLKPVGEWNSEEIVCDGRQVKVKLNGVVIVDANLDQVGPIDGDEHPGLKRENGHIGFLGHTGSVQFRHIQIRELPKQGSNANNKY